MTAQESVLEARLGHRFTRRDLLRQALTHRSYSARHNERLEFLGDGVLNCVVGLLLYERFPDLPEGRLSRLRANLVNQESLHEIARQLELGACLYLGEGEEKSGGRQRPSILADALEALIGAVALDGGLTAAQGVIASLYASRIAAIDPSLQGKDAKTRLQEWLQSRRHALPEYRLLGVSGLAHAQTFQVECRLESLGLVTRGQGASRKAAEQQAAQAALERLEGGGSETREG